MKRLIVQEGSYTGLIHLKPDEIYHGTVLWDDSKDGPIPSSATGKEKYLKLQNGSLVEDSVAKSGYDVAELAKTNAASAKKAKKDSLAAYDGSDVGAGAALLDLLKALGLHS